MSAPARRASSRWKPGPEELSEGREVYVEYATGLALINDPAKFKELHKRDVQLPEQADQVVVHAQALMWRGLKGVIRCANPPSATQVNSVENNYAEALAHMRSILDFAFETDKERLERLNPMLSLIRPLPVARQSVYRYVAHSRTDKIRIDHLVQPFTISDDFEQLPDYERLGRRTFTSIPRHSEAGTAPLRVVK